MVLEMDMSNLHMELKVCEGCGVLWLRSGQAATVYCRGCAAKLSEFPAALGRRLPRGPRVRRADAAVVRRSGLRMVDGAARDVEAAGRMVAGGSR